MFVHRSNTDNNYLYSKAVYESAAIKSANGQGLLDLNYFTNWKATLSIGATFGYYFFKQFYINGGIIYSFIINPNYMTHGFADDITIHNFNLSIGLKYAF